jgi:very-short-patch-repair endonuclease
MWETVRNRQFRGYKFLRQYPIQFKLDGRFRFFVADFYCAKLKLAIELDGKIHEQQKEYDAIRTFIINQLGIRVVRIPNEVIQTKEDAIYQLERFIL